MPPEDDDDEVLDDDLDIDLGDEGDGDLEIDLDDDDDGEAPSKEERSRNKAFAAMRIENKALKDSLDNLTTQVAGLKPAAPAYTPPAPTGFPSNDAEWDDLAEKDWKKAVDLRSSQNAHNIIRQQQVAHKATSTLEEAKQKVLALHPEINDNNSEKARIFTQVLNENPDYLTHPKGPIYAMKDMEDYMESTLGYKRKDIRTAEQEGAKREASRQNRIILNKGGGRANGPTGNKIVLSKDEMEFCKFQGIDPKEYARNKQKLSKSGSKEGVSI